MGGSGAGCRAGGIRQRWHPFDPPLCSSVDHRGRSSGFASRRLASRVCLLKGCGTLFVPHHHHERYCSEEGVHAARIWRRWLADQKYRATEPGKRRRQQQSQRYRERCPEEPEPMSETPATPREGDPKDESGKKCCCHRPGCYTRFTPPPQSPHQKYCSVECHEAMRTVLVREKRWRQKVFDTRRQRPGSSP